MTGRRAGFGLAEACPSHSTSPAIWNQRRDSAVCVRAPTVITVNMTRHMNAYACMVAPSNKVIQHIQLRESKHDNDNKTYLAYLIIYNKMKKSTASARAAIVAPADLAASRRAAVALLYR